MHYYALIDGETNTLGPYTPGELLRAHDDGTFPDGTLGAAAGDSFWQPMPSILRLARVDYEQSLKPKEELDHESMIAHAIQSGPPTSPVLLQLLREDGHAFPIPRKKHRS